MDLWRWAPPSSSPDIPGTEGYGGSSLFRLAQVSFSGFVALGATSSSPDIPGEVLQDPVCSGKVKPPAVDLWCWALPLLPQISQVRFWRIRSAQVSSSLLQWICGAGHHLLLPQISQLLKVLEDPVCSG